MLHSMRRQSMVFIYAALARIPEVALLAHQVAMLPKRF
jgi:hypothetical protein